MDPGYTLLASFGSLGPSVDLAPAPAIGHRLSEGARSWIMLVLCASIFAGLSLFLIEELRARQASGSLFGPDSAVSEVIVLAVVTTVSGLFLIGSILDIRRDWLAKVSEFLDHLAKNGGER